MSARNQIQAYVGDGKGKTTAALGLLLRFLGNGGKAALIQFDKGGDEELYSERKLFPSLPGLTFHATGLQRFNPAKETFRFNNIPEDLKEAARGLSLATDYLEQGFGLLVLDEVLSLLLTNLVQEKELQGFLDRYEELGRPCELVLTGHRLPESLAQRMDLITEMRKQKHYFDQALKARKGIEF